MTHKKLLLVAIFTTAALGLQGCSDRDVNFGVGVVVGGIIGHEIGDHQRDHGRWDHCTTRRCYHHIEAQPLAETSDDASLVAQKYQIPMYSAVIIVDSLQRAQRQDYTAMQDLGLSQEDILAMYNNQNPSVTGLLNLSERLDMDLGETHNLIQSMKIDIQAEKARRHMLN